MRARRSRFLAVTALAALLCGLAHDRPCVDEDAGAPHATVPASPACPASDQHHDPEGPDHGCACLCHVPAVATGAVAHAAPDALVAPAGLRLRSALRPGAVEAPFRPPRA